MYRIDENTLIDDSLVTCAEYQLFIDEMRAQGQYHQPDHWKSHQYPAGQSRLPILGIRPSDAKAFCDWLTHREGGAWRYRIPTLMEAAEFQLPPSNISPLGYWISGTDGQAKFAWVGPAPVDFFALDLDFIANNIAPVFDPNRAIDLPRDLACIVNRALDLSLDRAPALNRIIHIHDIRKLDYGETIDILTLQERVADHSPAFEGLRLVKERNVSDR